MLRAINPMITPIRRSQDSHTATLLSTPRAWPRSGWFTSQRPAWYRLWRSCLFCSTEPWLSHLLLWQREKTSENPHYRGRQKDTVCQLPQNKPSALKEKDMKWGSEWKILGSSRCLPKRWGSRRDSSKGNGMRTSERPVCVKGECSWRDTMRKKEKGEKNMNDTTFLVCNCFM